MCKPKALPYNTFTDNSQFGTFTPEEATRLHIEPNVGERGNPRDGQSDDEVAIEKDAAAIRETAI